MITCTRRIQFCAGHRVLGHENKCAHPHGHNYVVLVEAAAPDLDDVGRIIDFSVLKHQVGGWIEDTWDHGFLIFREDLELHDFFDGSPWKYFLMDRNPTAENMAELLLRDVGPLVLEGTDVTLTKVTLWETENCFATAVL